MRTIAKPLAITTVFSVCLLGVATGADWPRFRGLDGKATSTDSNLPLTWSATKNMLWKTPLPGHGASSPIVYGNKVFLSAFANYGLDADDPGSSEDLQLHVLCIDKASGDILWDTSHAAGPVVQNATHRIADHGYASSTPACDESGVYTMFGTSGVDAYDLDGTLKWTADIGEGTAGFGSAASPILFKDLVIVNASIESKTLFAFNKHNGQEVWRAEDIQRSWSTPTVAYAADGRPEMIMNQLDNIYGFDPETGEKLWTCSGIPDYVIPCVVADAGVAYCIGGRSNRAVAVRLGGRGDVSESHKLWDVSVGANVTSPVYHDGYLYWASDKGIAGCLDAKTGNTVYRKRLPTRARIYASVVLADGKLYCTTRDSGVIVLRAAPEFHELARNEIDGDESMFNASPAISDGRILLRTNQFLYAIGNKAAN